MKDKDIQRKEEYEEVTEIGWRVSKLKGCEEAMLVKGRMQTSPEV